VLLNKPPDSERKNAPQSVNLLTVWDALLLLEKRANGGRSAQS